MMLLIIFSVALSERSDILYCVYFKLTGTYEGKLDNMVHHILNMEKERTNQQTDYSHKGLRGT